MSLDMELLFSTFSAQQMKLIKCIHSYFMHFQKKKNESALLATFLTEIFKFHKYSHAALSNKTTQSKATFALFVLASENLCLNCHWIKPTWCGG